MKIESANYPEDDYMQIGRFFSVDIFKPKIVRYIIQSILYLQIILIIVQTYKFLKIFEVTYLILNASEYFIAMYNVVALTTVLIATPMTKENMIELKPWNVNHINGKFRQRIKMESKFITTYLFVSTVLTFIPCIFHIFAKEEEKQTFFALAIFKEFPQSCEKILRWYYNFSYIIMGFVYPATCNQLIYVTSHIRHQVYILLNHLESLNEDFDTLNDLNLYYNSEYQKQIKEMLILFAKRYVELTGLIRKIRNKIQLFIIFYLATGIALGISILIFLITLQGRIEFDYIRILSIIVGGSVTLTAVISAGQEIENTGEEVLTVLEDLKWYTWNEENKQYYSILISYITEPFRIEFTDKISVNFKLLLYISRTLYSMASVLHQLQ